MIDFNSTVLASFVREWGGAPIKYPRARDDMSALMQAVRRAAEECDIVTIIAGSSAGEHDLTADVVAEAGELLAHGIDVMPGKPAVLGSVGNKPLLGVPGYPVSAIVIAREILRPALEKFLGVGGAGLSDCARRLPKKIASHLGLEEFIRVTLGRVNEKLVAVPLATRRGRDHHDGACRWFDAHSESRRRIQCGRGGRGRTAAADRRHRKYDSLHRQPRSWPSACWKIN